MGRCPRTLNTDDCGRRLGSRVPVPACVMDDGDRGHAMIEELMLITRP